MQDSVDFASASAHGFFRVAVCTPRVEVAAPGRNVQRVISLAQQAYARKAALVLFPELGLSAYSNEHLVLQDALLDGVESAVDELLDAGRELDLVLVVGGPARSIRQRSHLRIGGLSGFRPGRRDLRGSLGAAPAD